LEELGFGFEAVFGVVRISKTWFGPTVFHGIEDDLLGVGGMVAYGNGRSQMLRLKLSPVFALVECYPMVQLFSDRDSYFIVEGVLYDADGLYVFLLLPGLSGIVGPPYTTGFFGEDDDVGIVEVEEVPHVGVEDMLGDLGLVIIVLGGGERSCCE
jgi:hypothetical protein